MRTIQLYASMYSHVVVALERILYGPDRPYWARTKEIATPASTEARSHSTATPDEKASTTHLDKAPGVTSEFVESTSPITIPDEKAAETHYDFDAGVTAGIPNPTAGGHDGPVTTFKSVTLAVNDISTVSATDYRGSCGRMELLRRLLLRPEATWHPTIFNLRALSGIAGLCITVGCVFTSLIVLITSDGQAVESWPIQPTVYLAIITAVANSAIAVSRMEAVPVHYGPQFVHTGTVS